VREVGRRVLFFSNSVRIQPPELSCQHQRGKSLGVGERAKLCGGGREGVGN